MAAAVSSPWSKPGKWALDSEEHDDELLQQQQQHQKDVTEREDGLFDFPSLAAAAANIPKSKKKKAQTLSLAEFNIGKPVGPGTGKAARTAHLNRPTTDELLSLPTGPREHTAEELERSRHGFRSYGHNDNAGRNRYSNGDDSSNSRWGASRVSEEPRKNGGFNRDSAPSRADEIDDWGAAKKSTSASAFERREKVGFFDSQSRADESDSWLCNKTFTPSEGRKFGGGFENHKERRGGFDMFQKETSNGGGAGSDTWGKKREEGSASASGRPRLVLQPRTLPVNVADQQQPESGSTMRGKGSNPFGEARPREEVLAEKGQDWKKIDEQLESMKLKEMDSGGSDGPSLGKRSSGSGNEKASLSEDFTERNWRKTDTDTVDAATPRKTDEGVAAQN